MTVLVFLMGFQFMLFLLHILAIDTVLLKLALDLDYFLFCETTYSAMQYSVIFANRKMTILSSLVHCLDCVV
jgi:hypothetical protein